MKINSKLKMLNVIKEKTKAKRRILIHQISNKHSTVKNIIKKIDNSKER